MSDFRNGVSLAAEYGGSNIDMIPDVLIVNRLLQMHCRGPYGDVLGFPLALRVDGDVKKYGGDGVERLKVHLKQKYVTCDICVPEKRWRGIPRPQLHRFLWCSVRQALEQITAELTLREIPCDTEKLWSELKEAESDDLKHFPQIGTTM